MRSLKEIVNAITPDNIIGVNVLKDTTDIFIELLEELSSESIDIYSRMENRLIREQYIKTYLGDYYQTLNNIQKNQKLIDVINYKNSLYSSNENFEYISPNISEDIFDEITDEHFLTFKSYREKKGTLAALEYIYTLISTLIKIDEYSAFKAEAGKNPFELNVEGSLPAEFYHYLVSPLARPFGFTTNYSELLELHLEDRYFPGSVTWEVSLLEVVCLCSPPGTIGSQDTCSTDFSNREVIDVVERMQGWPKLTKIFFGGEYAGEYLEQIENSNGQISVQLLNETRVINPFNEHCSINHIINQIVTAEPAPTILTSEIHSYLEDEFNTDDVEEEFSITPTYFEDRMPYINWETCNWWEYIGSSGSFTIKNIGSTTFYVKTSDDTIGGEIKCGGDDTFFKIGAENAFIWNKNERVEDKDQPYANLDYDSFENAPWGDRPGTYDARLKLCGTDIIRYNPWTWNKSQAYITGDPYYATIRYEKIGHYGEPDFKFTSVTREAKVFGEKSYWVNAFDQNSDESCDNKFDFGVYRNGERLEDNNLSARVYIVVGNDWLIDDFDVDGVHILSGP